MIFGNVILGICAITLMHASGRSTWVTDTVFWATVVLLIVLRRIDIARFSGLTATGKPATTSHWKRYSIILVIISAVVWVIAHQVRGSL
jgi:uncharacterized membrane protein YjfL (UPF0719 family)